MKYTKYIIALLVAAAAAYLTSKYTQIDIAYVGGEFFGGILGAMVIMLIITYFAKPDFSNFKIFLIAILISAGLNLAPKIYETHMVRSIIAMYQEALARSANGEELKLSDFDYKNDFEKLVMSFAVGNINLEGRTHVITQAAKEELQLSFSNIEQIMDGEITEERSAFYIRELRYISTQLTALKDILVNGANNYDEGSQKMFLDGTIKSFTPNYKASQAILRLHQDLLSEWGNIQQILIDNRGSYYIENNQIMFVNQDTLELFNAHFTAAQAIEQELAPIEEMLYSRVQSMREKANNF